MEENRCDTHVFDYKTLAAILLALLVLTTLTVSISYIDLGKLNVWIALLIASFKASLVLLYFMHMKFEGKVIVYSFLGTIFFLGIMIGFTFFDVGFR